MKMPCDTCLVDLVCIKKCDKLTEFINFLNNTRYKTIPPNLITNHNRYHRICLCCEWDKLSFKFYANLSNYIRQRLCDILNENEETK